MDKTKCVGLQLPVICRSDTPSFFSLQFIENLTIMLECVAALHFPVLKKFNPRNVVGVV